MKNEIIAIESKASQHPSELFELLNILDTNPPKTVLEIGIDQGYLLETWDRAYHPNLVIGVDIHRPNRDVEVANYTFVQYSSHDVFGFEYIKRLMPKVDLLFIDGDHSYQGVKQDFETYSPLVNKGGFIVLHDVCYHADNTEEVDVFWNEIKDQYKTKTIHYEGGTGTGVIYW